jgi:hypothetical protein
MAPFPAKQLLDELPFARPADASPFRRPAQAGTVQTTVNDFNASA